MRRTTLAAVALAPVCALALSACGSSSGSGGGSGSASAANATSAAENNAHLTSAQVNARINAAVLKVTALHMKGTMTESGTTVSFDLQLNKDSAQGTIGEGGMQMPIVAVGGVSYFQLTPSVVKYVESSQDSSSSDALGALLVENRWISSKSSIGASFGQSFGPMTNLSSMTKQLTSGAQDTLTYLGTSTLDGQQVAQYKDHSSDGSGPDTTMSLPLTGTALPIQLDGGSQGLMAFTWNQSTTVSAPPANEILNLPGTTA